MLTTANVLRREVLQLVVLILIAVAAFFVTRAVAASNRNMNLRDAAEWYQRGQTAVAAERLPDAIEAFRRATVRNRYDKRYTLALAHALALHGETGPAQRALLGLRNNAPEDHDVNLELARLAASTHDLPEALRYYHSALYAAWPDQQAGSQREIRLELIRFLIANRFLNRAESEILALSSDLPDDVAHRLEVARLFMQTGDDRRALEQFQRALGQNPDNHDALAGAGQAAFGLADYRAAQRYFRKLPSDLDDVRETRELVDLVMSSDPWAARIGSAERRRRLVADFSHAQARLEGCFSSRAGSLTSEETALQNDARAFSGQLKSSAVLEQDRIEAGFDVIARIERATSSCVPPTPLDRALVLIGGQHAGDSR
jgi:tetratricopeptide (TPR) repeat protein